MEHWTRKQYAVATLAIVWGLSLTTAITLKVFFDPVAIPAGTATAFGTFFALPPSIFGLIKWRQNSMQKKQQDKSDQ